MSIDQITTHYSVGQDMVLLGEFAKKNATALVNHFKGLKRKELMPLLVYSGMSGTSLATALALELSNKKGFYFGMAYVRKDEEKSHGRPLEWSMPAHIKSDAKVVLPIFVDDIISSGDTLSHAFSNVFTLFPPQYTIEADSDYYTWAVLQNYQGLNNYYHYNDILSSIEERTAIQEKYKGTIAKNEKIRQKVLKNLLDDRTVKKPKKGFKIKDLKVSPTLLAPIG